LATYPKFSYTVPQKYQGRGIAKAAVVSSIAELKNELVSTTSSFLIEAVVGVDNEASKRIAEVVLYSKPPR
jgi:RimJ/RimL family protein N-acetyltransferase